MSALQNERTPLLGNSNDRPTITSIANEVDAEPGPREIASSTRYGILAGVFLGTFLAVSFL